MELADERLDAEFTNDPTFDLTPRAHRALRTRNEGIVGVGVDLELDHAGDIRTSTLVYHLTDRLLETSGATRAVSPGCTSSGN